MSNYTTSRRLLSVIITIMLSAVSVFALTGCGQSNVKLDPAKVNVVTTFYPLYDFSRQIGGEHVNVINLVPAGVEPHEWSPKSRDLKNMTQAQLFVYNGAGFEGWVHDFLDSRKDNAKPIVIEASQGIPLLNASEEEGHDHDHKHEAGVDPHVWVSPKSAIRMAESIKNGLIQVDQAHKADYEANYARLAAQLQALDAKFKDSLAKAPRKEIVVSHQAFSYLARDYGLTQMPIMGLSPDSEPTAKDMMAINKFVKEHQVKYIFFEELVSDKLAKTLAGDAKIETLVLNPLEGLTEEQIRAGENYISVMERNLQNLLKALQ
ncbi:metal ABC transporter substrate-binding protein [Paenibacillus koleovorans]|uniref:metal ABC transporter substrate-binding protein n=1 Tax=Paenibacillus koleovorans TaxID=121608 RepID=UPI001C3F8B20|nr:metal ABC transporter substrate-binding protein [Paenibacillus koleovorans]